MIAHTWPEFVDCSRYKSRPILRPSLCPAIADITEAEEGAEHRAQSYLYERLYES